MSEVKDVLDINGACEFLGISIKTFQKLLREENIPGPEDRPRMAVFPAGPQRLGRQRELKGV